MRCKSFVRLAALLLIGTPPVLLAFQAAPPASSQVQQQQHPLDPLTAAEIDASAAALRASSQFPADGLFSMLTLKEPPKNAVLAFAPGASIPRQAFAVILDRKRNRTFEAVVDLTGARIAFLDGGEGRTATRSGGRIRTLSRIVKADARWQAAMRKRGIDDFEKVQIDGWAVGQVAPQYQGRRLLRAVSYFKGDSINFYGRPIEGVVVLVNMNTEKVVEVVDTGRRPACAAEPGAGRKIYGRRGKRQSR